MKKVISIMLALALCLFAFASCKGGDEKDAENASTIVGNYSIKNFEDDDNDDFIVEIQDLGGVYSELYDKNGLYIKFKGDEQIVDKEGNPVSRDDLTIGTTLQISYTGELVKKNPKTIKAYKITVVD